MGNAEYMGHTARDSAWRMIGKRSISTSRFGAPNVTNSSGALESKDTGALFVLSRFIPNARIWWILLVLDTRQTPMLRHSKEHLKNPTLRKTDDTSRITQTAMFQPSTRKKSRLPQSKDPGHLLLSPVLFVLTQELKRLLTVPRVSKTYIPSERNLEEVLSQ